LRSFFGDWLEDKLHQTFPKRVNFVIFSIYFGTFLVVQSYLNSIEYFNMNNFANMRSNDGEVLTGIIATHYPDKIYQDRFQAAMRAKQE
jgi:hypothetical protein